jgi:hypothetical protein
MIEDYNDRKELREDYIKRMNQAMDEVGVFSMRHLARIVGVSPETVRRYRNNHYIRLRFLPMELFYQAKLENAVFEKFKDKAEFLGYLGWSDSWTRKVSRRYDIELPDFRKITKSDGSVRKKWQRGIIADNREIINKWLDSGVYCSAIASTLELRKQTVWQYKKDRERGLADG